MEYNVFMKVNFSVPFFISNEKLRELVEDEMEQFDKIYSYIVHVKKDKFNVQINLSEKDKYNVLVASDAVGEICEAISSYCDDDTRSIIAYKQPSIEVMVELFDPLVCSLASEQHTMWKDLEYEDLCQICRMTMVKLYNKGYYIHKSLLSRSFNNEILMMLRSDKNKPIIVSIDDKIRSSKTGDERPIEDTLIDTSYDEERETQEREEFIHKVFDEVREVIINIIGVRQFEELMRDYAGKHTNPWSRTMMNRLKKKFNKLGIEWKSFNKYL